MLNDLTLNQKHRENFMVNHKFIAETNAKNKENKKSLRLQVNRNSIYSFDEFNNMFLKNENINNDNNPEITSDEVATPDTVVSSLP